MKSSILVAKGRENIVRNTEGPSSQPLDGKPRPHYASRYSPNTSLSRSEISPTVA